MTLEELKLLKAELDELVNLRENMAATQSRCTDLLLENRRLNKELACAHAALAESFTYAIECMDRLDQLEPATAKDPQ